MNDPNVRLQELITARDADVQRMAQARQSAQLEMDRRAENSSGRTMRSLGDLADVVRKLQDNAQDYAKETSGLISDAKARISERPKEDPAALVEERAAAVSAAALYAVLVPYYVRLYNSDGTTYYSAYSPGSVDLRDDAQGSGNGWFGSGAASIDVLADWWYYFSPNTDRWYNYTIVAPMHGFYICYADDGFWDSKEAHVKADISATGYQYTWKPTTTTNLFDYDGQNINLANRYDNSPVFYYSDLLGADTAYVRVTQSLYGYARGDGSHAELNFSDGSANYLSPPTIYVT